MTSRELEQLQSMQHIFVDRRHRRKKSSSAAIRHPPTKNVSAELFSDIEMNNNNRSPCMKWMRISQRTKLGYRCSSCPYFSVRKSNVGRHFDRKHIELKKPKKCTVCCKVFKTKGEYHDHENQHQTPLSNNSVEDEMCVPSSRQSEINSKMDTQNNNDIHTESLELDYNGDSEHSSIDENSCPSTNQLPWSSTSTDVYLLSKKYQPAERDAVMALLLLHCPDYYLRHENLW
ncbi:hypothetical protein QAD02_001237 [Eretmocerus hayati]|uniref:Uncharacterized protein n=1 Tax=Eretmocerus hayati TaxID=131215 RepID=A0ACC2NGQ1_9HYME|nr:hypothetical protein QAD02_001237 [Eretmocerus hayati]